MNFSKKAIKIVFTTKIIIFIIFTVSTVYAELKIDSVYPTLGLLGQDLEVTLKGSGFDANTRVSMYLDSGNKRAIIGSVNTPKVAESVTVVGTTACEVDENRLFIVPVSTEIKPVTVVFLKTRFGIKTHLIMPALPICRF